MMSNVICLCSRGLIHSRTVDLIFQNLENVEGSWVPEWTHNEPIPDAQNRIVEKAKKHDPEWLWFVEEDMGPPPHTLKTLLSAGRDYDVVFAKYRMPGGNWCHLEKNGKIVFSGLGCLLVKMSVFERIGEPYFRSDLTFDEDLRPTGSQPGDAYGRQDIYFFHKLTQCSIPFLQLNIECEHYRVKKLGNVVHNNGFHEVVTL